LGLRNETKLVLFFVITSALLGFTQVSTTIQQSYAQGGGGGGLIPPTPVGGVLEPVNEVAFVEVAFVALIDWNGSMKGELTI